MLFDAYSPAPTRALGDAVDRSALPLEGQLDPQVGELGTSASLRAKLARAFPGLAAWPVEKWLVAPAIVFIAAPLIYRIAFDLVFDLIAK